MEPEDESNNMVSRGSKGLGPIVPEQGEQGRPGGGSQVQMRVQIFRQVHSNYTGLRSSREGEPASQGQE